MAEPSHRIAIVVAVIGLIGTIVAALIQSWDKIAGRDTSIVKVSEPHLEREEPSNPIANTPEPRTNMPEPIINISGVWIEEYPTPGNVSQTTQVGNTFQFTIRGMAQGRPFQSSGSGTINGRHIESTYQSTIPSTGRCEGSVSTDGTRITSTCTDSVYGQFQTAGVRD